MTWLSLEIPSAAKCTSLVHQQAKRERDGDGLQCFVKAAGEGIICGSCSSCSDATSSRSRYLEPGIRLDFHSSRPLRLMLGMNQVTSTTRVLGVVICLRSSWGVITSELVALCERERLERLGNVARHIG